MKMLELCALSEHYHERRLASEGSRPKLPWAKKLTVYPTVPMYILDKLYYDKTRYVTRSVANHLNDISKIDPFLTLETLKRWKTSGKQDDKEMQYIVKHALRTLVKKGDKEALALLGYATDPKITLSNTGLSQETVNLGEDLHIEFDIEAEDSCHLCLDYVMHFKTKNGTFSEKVYKIKSLSLKRGGSIRIRKKHLFKANMTTRKLYAGEHKIQIQINGKCYEAGSFILKT
jgi:3-methyladenine DNA glycosylase AlkC